MKTHKQNCEWMRKTVEKREQRERELERNELTLDIISLISIYQLNICYKIKYIDSEYETSNSICS